MLDFPDDRSHALGLALIDEARHRHANEFACALAALQLTRARSTADIPLIDDAIKRLEGSVRLERLLLNAEAKSIEETLLSLCSLLSVTRGWEAGFLVTIRGEGASCDAGRMKIMLLVAYELLANAIERSGEHGDKIRVRMHRRPGMLRLSVANRLPELPKGATSGSRRGSGLSILSRLLTPVGGRVACRREGEKFVAQAFLPVPPLDAGFRRIQASC